MLSGGIAWIYYREVISVTKVATVQVMNSTNTIGN